MIYILLPIYNEAESIATLLERIKKGMERRQLQYKMVVYNDGSTDNTLEILNKYQASVPLYNIGSEDNKGLGFAFHSLIDEVCVLSQDEDDIAVCLDADNTHNPEHIYDMVNKIQNGFDLVIASRFLKDSRIVGVSRYRNFLSYEASLLMRMLFPIKGIKDYTCGYRAYSIALLKKAKEIYGDHLIKEIGFTCMTELLIKLSRFQLLAVEIPLVLRYDQKKGKSKMNIINTVARTIEMMTRLFLSRREQEW